MDIVTKKTVDMLTHDSVSILTQKFVTVEGTEQQVGGNHRVAYVNSNLGRTNLQENEPDYVQSAVLSYWGDTATVDDEVNTFV